jgi:hypothetical protein
MHKLTNASEATMTLQVIYPIGLTRGLEIITGTPKELSCRTLLGTAICFKPNGGPERTARMVKWQEGDAFPSENDMLKSEENWVAELSRARSRS